MPTITFRRLLAKLTALALSTGAAAGAAPTAPDPSPLSSAPTDIDDDADGDLDASLDLDLRDHLDPTDAALALGRGLAQALQAMRPIDAIHVASTWSLSPDHVRRLAVAHSLEWMFPLVADAIVIDHLSRDPAADIRVATARAAIARPTTDPNVLVRLSEDPDAEVREIARSARR